VVVSHLSVEEEPLSGLVTEQEAVLSSQYCVAVVVSVGEYGAPDCAEVRVGAVGEPPPMTE